jgi:hypothetical protein
MKSKHVVYKQDWTYHLCVCVCVRACVRVCVCVRACVFSLLSEALSWKVLKVAWEVSLFIEWVDVIG